PPDRAGAGRQASPPAGRLTPGYGVRAATVRERNAPPLMVAAPSFPVRRDASLGVTRRRDPPRPEDRAMRGRAVGRGRNPHRAIDKTFGTPQQMTGPPPGRRPGPDGAESALDCASRVIHPRVGCTSPSQSNGPATEITERPRDEAPHSRLGGQTGQ